MPMVSTETHGRLVRRLSEIAALDERLVLGLSSGTSFDGVDVALVRISGAGGESRIELLWFECAPFAPKLRERIAASFSASAGELARLNIDLGDAFSEAALAALANAGYEPSDIHVIGSHGQTVYHDPAVPGRGGATLQIGEADVIARRTGVMTIADFRAADVAAGGSGAPLIPYVDWILFRQPAEARLLVNIGGISNVSYIVPDVDDVVAFDCGPGNSLSDEIMRISSREEEALDTDGERALRGTPRDAAVEEFLRQPYFSQPPPKSTGRELFGRDAARSLSGLLYRGRRIEELPDGELCDLLATAARVVARTIRDALGFLPCEPAVAGVFVSGGGVKNKAIMSDLSRLFEPIPVASLDVLGIDPDAKEALGFAALANESLLGRPGNLRAATGARERVVLGKISCGL